MVALVNGVDIVRMAHTNVYGTSEASPTTDRASSNRTPSNQMMEMDLPLTLNPRRRLSKVSICNKTLKAKSQREKTLHYSSE